MTNKSKYILLIAGCLAMILGGCTVKTVVKQWIPIQGNKDDGIITLGYYYPAWGENPIADEQQGLDTASQTCRTLGYKTAIIYDIAQATCVVHDYSQSGKRYCTQYQATRNYQCQ